ncbi:serine/threonine-protein kinase [Hamiltosporidium tvaerminnensis]|uniref:Serine/threonine-protein kinase n=1 Tax=Hamiltosporidium tvaerminnensis TaxID=1176355 RepID=A0A4V2JVU7_9MICR|nr:hypothetical protein LUQ84_000473 [Hamiltosporidium tvaerminnensis]TBU05452.1 serine/threonine-protein kinase [Hamiltosporidium tvaerminnensis]TBU12462.1 serine/threonine-protein kinase [Hamiltosporidium tvaerminnensis]
MKFFLFTILLVKCSEDTVLKLNTKIRIEFDDKSYEEYIVEEKLGSGTNGNVYKCKNQQSNEIFAIKLSNSDIYKRSIENEKHVYTNYSNEKILKFYKCGMYKWHISALILELGEKTLYQYLKNTLLKDKEKAILIRQVVLALSYLHLSGIIYNDLKSKNIMIFGKTKCKLFDFGLSIKARSKPELAFIYNDDPKKYFYLSPEFKKNINIDFKTDMWSFGVLICRMYSIEIIKNKPVFRTSDEDLKDCINICLQKDAKKRPSSSLILYHIFFDRIFTFLDEIEHIKNTFITIGTENILKKELNSIYCKYKNHEITLVFDCTEYIDSKIINRLTKDNITEYLERIRQLKYSFKVSKYVTYMIKYNSNPMIPIIELEYNCVSVIEKLIILLKLNFEDINLIKNEIESLDMKCFETNFQEIFQLKNNKIKT